LTKGEATRFITRDWQIQEATEFAGKTFKRFMYYTCDHPDVFLPEVTAALTAFEEGLIAEQASVVETASTFFDTGKDQLAQRYLPDYSSQVGDTGLQLGRALIGSIEARTELLYGLREPQTDVVSRLNYNQGSCMP
jgi:hypothetical protein